MVAVDRLNIARFSIDGRLWLPIHTTPHRNCAQRLGLPACHFATVSSDASSTTHTHAQYPQSLDQTSSRSGGCRQPAP